MRRHAFPILVASAMTGVALLLGACGTHTDERAGSGAMIGAATGGTIGLAFGGIGAIPGALIGAAVGGGTGATTNASQVDLGKPVWE